MTDSTRLTNLTPILNEYNVENVRRLIIAKKSPIPVYSTLEQGMNVITDMDHYPYTRFYRGVPFFPNPVVMEREAGWRPTHDPCYRINRLIKPTEYPNHCFEAPCSTVYPCFPKYVRKYDDKMSLDVLLNNTCTLQYR